MKAPRRLGDGNAEDNGDSARDGNGDGGGDVDEMMISAMKTNSSLNFEVRTRFENELVSRF